MKNLLALLLLAAPAFAESPEPAVPETCPCTQARFRAMTERAVAVDEFWRAREAWRQAGRLAIAEYLAAGLLGTRTPGLNATENAAADAQRRMLDARERAAALGGLKIHGRHHNSYAPVTVTLVPSVDYELAEPPPVDLPR